MTKIQKFTNFDYQTPLIVPTLIKGKDAKRLFNAVSKDDSNFSKELEFLDFDLNAQEMRGSNPLRAGQINRIIKDSGLRVAVPTDDIYNVIFPLIKDKFYTDLNALDIREKTPEYEKNIALWKKLIELAEEKQGSVKFPFRIQGFYVEPDKNETGYGVKIVPAENFRIITDKRLNLESGTKFSGLDETGMIIQDKKGEHEWHSIKDGVSRVYLSRNSYLYSNYGDLDDSNSNGRGVLVKERGK